MYNIVDFVYCSYIIEVVREWGINCIELCFLILKYIKNLIKILIYVMIGYFEY